MGKSLKELISEEESKVRSRGMGSVGERKKAIAVAVELFLKEKPIVTSTKILSAVRDLASEKKFYIRAGGPRTGYGSHDINSYSGLSNPYLKHSPTIQHVSLHDVLKRELKSTPPSLKRKLSFPRKGPFYNTAIFYIEEEKLRVHLKPRIKIRPSHEEEDIEIVTIEDLEL